MKEIELREGLFTFPSGEKPSTSAIMMKVNPIPTKHTAAPEDIMNTYNYFRTKSHKAIR
jgi:hypothetical protein